MTLTNQWVVFKFGSYSNQWPKDERPETAKPSVWNFHWIRGGTALVPIAHTDVEGILQDGPVVYLMCFRVKDNSVLFLSWPVLDCVILTFRKEKGNGYSGLTMMNWLKWKQPCRSSHSWLLNRQCRRISSGMPVKYCYVTSLVKERDPSAIITVPKTYVQLCWWTAMCLERKDYYSHERG